MSEELVLESRSSLLLAPASRPSGGVETDAQLAQDLKSIPDKMAFKIGEVADIVGVKAYVLRYWETEFEQLKPKKSKHNQRMYERRDVEALLMIKKLLYRDRFSIEGAKAALRRLKKDSQAAVKLESTAEQIERACAQLEDLIDSIKGTRQRWQTDLFS